MRSNLPRLFASCLVIFFTFMTLNAQDDALGAAAGDRYVISARAGNVNYVQGAVGIVRKVGKSGVLVKGDRMEIGDRVSTGADGRAELLMNPGSYVRLGGNTAFEFQTTSLDDLKLRLDSGSAIFEVYATEEFKVEVKAPKMTYELVETGIYRVNVLEGGASRLEVWKGHARVGPFTDLIKAGRAVTTDNTGSPQVAKFDRDKKDPLDTWSKERGRDLTRITANLRTVNLRPNLISSFREGWWNLYYTFGLWVYDPFFGGYTFLPFGHGWNSPYGMAYNNCVHNYDLPPIVYAPPVHTPNNLPTTGGGSTSTPTTTSSSSAPTTLGTPHTTRGATTTASAPPPDTLGSPRIDRSVPVFVIMQDAMGGGRGGSVDSGGGSSGGSDTRYDGGHSSHSSSSSSSSSSGSSSPPPSSPPPSSPPSDLGTGKGGKP